MSQTEPRFGARSPGGPLFIGVVHLLPLPGSPSPSPGLDAVLARAEADADALVAGGVDGIIVENLGDAPFVADVVAPETVAFMTRAVWAVRARCPGRLLGVNVLRNDAAAALGVAAATGADFIRVNVHTGVMITDQGMITGQARRTLLDRQRLAPQVRIVADVLVKHAVPIGAPDLRDVASDTAKRGRADALIVTGSGTGRPLNPAHLDVVREAAPSAPVWAGSGVTVDSAPGLAGRLDGAIVGTALHHDGDLEAPLDVRRVRAMAGALRSRPA